VSEEPANTGGGGGGGGWSTQLNRCDIRVRRRRRQK